MPPTPAGYATPRHERPCKRAIPGSSRNAHVDWAIRLDRMVDRIDWLVQTRRGAGHHDAGLRKAPMSRRELKEVVICVIDHGRVPRWRGRTNEQRRRWRGSVMQRRVHFFFAAAAPSPHGRRFPLRRGVQAVPPARHERAGPEDSLRLQANAGRAAFQGGCGSGYYSGGGGPEVLTPLPPRRTMRAPARESLIKSIGVYGEIAINPDTCPPPNHPPFAAHPAGFAATSCRYRTISVATAACA